MNKPRGSKDYIIDIFNNGFTDGNYNPIEAFYIAKYFYWIENCGKQKTKTKLIEYCLEHDKNFNDIIFMDQIRKTVANAMKRKPSENKDIVITKAEIEKIETIKNYKDQKILFSILVVSKRSKFDSTSVREKRDYLGFHIHQNSIFDICNKCGLNLSFRKTMKHINKYIDLKFLEPNGEFANILYSIDNSQPLIEVLGDENPWDKFIEFNGGEFLYCTKCEDKFLKKSKYHNNEFCEKCSKERRLEKVKNNMKKYRDNKN
jgi:hypothetical protein